jgi:hypothetical protein
MNGIVINLTHSVDDVDRAEPTLTADGAWWHPVAVTNRHLQVADATLAA